MVNSDLEVILDNLSDKQLKLVTALSLRIAMVGAEKWTGKITIELNANQGTIGDMHVNAPEIIKF